MPKISIFVLLLTASGRTLFAETSPAQQDTTLEKKPPAKHKVTLSPYFEIPILELTFRPRTDLPEVTTNDKNAVAFKPNVQPDVGLRFGWQGYRVGIGVPISRPDEDDGKGKTRYYNYHFAKAWEHAAVQTGMHRFKGFYRDEEQTHADQKFDLADLSKREDFIQVQLSPWWWRYDQSDTSRVKVAPLFGFGYEDTHLKVSGTLFPDDTRAFFLRDQDFREGQFITQTFLFGGRGKIERGYWLGELSVFFGRARQSTELKDSWQQEESFLRFGQRFGFSFLAELFDDPWTYGVEMTFNQRDLPLKDSTIESEFGVITASLGRDLIL